MRFVILAALSATLVGCQKPADDVETNGRWLIIPATLRGERQDVSPGDVESSIWELNTKSGEIRYCTYTQNAAGAEAIDCKVQQ